MGKDSSLVIRKGESEMETSVCVCGKKCTSSPGLTLHQKNCEEAQRAAAEGRPQVVDEAVESEDGALVPQFSEPVQKFLDAAKEAAKDWELCLQTGNKSAGRRARVKLSAIKKELTPIRNSIQDLVKKT